jgi:hypothetical protein
MRQTIPGMQTMQLLASSGVTMAAGAMVSLSFVVSPPLTLVPPLPHPLDVNGNVTTQGHRSSETVGAAIAGTFERRWQPADESPLIPVPRRDPLEGLIGGLLTLPLVQDAPQLAQAEPEPQDLPAARQPQQTQEQVSVTVVPRESSAQASGVCARHGLRRIDYTQNHHRYWRCAARRG